MAVDASTTIIGPRDPLDGEVAIEKVIESPSTFRSAEGDLHRRTL